MSDAVSTTGILVKRATIAAPTVFTTVAEIVNVTPPGFSRNKLETSNHNEGVESYVLGILRQKDPTFRVNYVGDNATHETLLSDILANTKAHWGFFLPSGITIEGDGFLQRFELADAPVDGIQQADCAIAWSGAVTFDVA